MTSKGHRVIRGRSDLPYDPKCHGDLCDRFDLVNDQKSHSVIRGHHDLLYDPKGHGDLGGLYDLVHEPKRPQGHYRSP